MSLSYDFDKVFKEYQNATDDFGFSAVSEEEYNSDSPVDDVDLKV